MNKQKRLSIEYLENVQKYYHKSIGSKPANSSKANDLFSFSKHESPATKLTITNILKQIKGACEQLDIPFDTKEIIFGTLPKNNINARISKTPYDCKLILFNQGNFSSFNFLLKLLVQSVPFEKNPNNKKQTRFLKNEKKIRKHIKKNKKKLEKQLLEFLISYKILFNVEYCFQQTVSSIKTSYQNNLLFYLESFMIAHEYAHHYLGHLDSKPFNKSILSLKHVEQYGKKWRRELLADVTAMHIVLKMAEIKTKEKKRTLLPHEVYLACDFFFTSMVFLDKFNIKETVVPNKKGQIDISIYNNVKEIVTNSHPPLSIRRQVLRNTMKHNHLYLYKDAYPLLRGSEYLFDYFFERVNIELNISASILPFVGYEKFIEAFCTRFHSTN